MDADKEGLQAPVAMLLAVILKKLKQCNTHITCHVEPEYLKVHVNKVWKKLQCKVSMFCCTIFAYPVNCKEEITQRLEEGVRL